MNTNLIEVDRLLSTNDGVIARRHHPDLAETLAWLVRKGILVALLPGIYAVRSRAGEEGVRMRAAMLWDPDLVLVGRAAARITFWPDRPVSVIDLATPRAKASRPGYRVHRRRVPPELITKRHGLRCTVPALTALDLCGSAGGDAIDTVLRSRQARIDDLWQALRLTPHRVGNRDRRELLLDSRAEPWSAPERECHRLLRAAGIGGWQANYLVQLPGIAYFIDVAFPAVKLAIEIDGRRFHETPEAFEYDRGRQNDLVLAGWRVLRFTWQMITTRPLVVLAAIREALAQPTAC